MRGTAWQEMIAIVRAADFPAIDLNGRRACPAPYAKCGPYFGGVFVANLNGTVARGASLEGSINAATVAGRAAVGNYAASGQGKLERQRIGMCMGRQIVWTYRRHV
jgi:hypothetical protein